MCVDKLNGIKKKEFSPDNNRLEKIKDYFLSKYDHIV